MDIVLLFNGLGNQMSQYAFYLAKRQTDAHTQWLYHPEQYTNQHNGYELERIFGIKMNNAKIHWIDKLYDWYIYANAYKTRTRSFVKWIMQHCNVTKYHEHSYNVDVTALSGSDSGYRFLYGGWHNPAYFSNVEEQVRQSFQFQTLQLDILNSQLIAKMQLCNSVAIHVRRGDFVKESELFGNIATSEYYKKAIEYIKQHVEAPVFFIFSDDISWCRENIKESDVQYVDCNSGQDSWKDMLLMSKCKHNINANSTFSWWGAWLNDNPKKIVVVPDKFTNVEGSEKIYPNEWIKIQRNE